MAVLKPSYDDLMKVTREARSAAVVLLRRAEAAEDAVERLREALFAVRDTAHDDERARIVDEALRCVVREAEGA